MVQWLCRLDPQELIRGEALAEEGRQHGIGAWLLEVSLTAEGSLEPRIPLEALLRGEALLPFCLSCRLPATLSPRGEDHAAQALVPFLAHPRAVRLGCSPLLVLENPAGFSHPAYGPQRFRLTLQRGLRATGISEEPLLLLGREEIHNSLNGAFDGRVEDLEGENSLQSTAGYERHLRRAHYRPAPTGLLIPTVRSPAPGEESGDQQRDRERYQEWLELAGAWTAVWHNGLPEAPVLVESWSGHQRWRPSPRFHAPPVHLPGPEEAESPEMESESGWGTPEASHLALLVHGFYLDRLEAMLGSVPAGGGQQGLPPMDLYLSTPRPQMEAAARQLQELGWPRVRLFGVANRGRDIAPFLRHLLPAALEDGHEAFVKLHTKASPHLEEDWGTHLVDSLLAPELLGSLGGRLQEDPKLGLLAPSGTLLPTTVALNHNAEHLMPLLQQRCIEGSWFLAQRFVAGSMMAGRLAALASLLQTPFPLEKFAPEAGQTDGTFAHALERWISAVVLAEGWKVEELPGPAHAVPGFGYRWVSELEG